MQLGNCQIHRYVLASIWQHTVENRDLIVQNLGWGTFFPQVVEKHINKNLLYLSNQVRPSEC